MLPDAEQLALRYDGTRRLARFFRLAGAFYSSVLAQDAEHQVVARRLGTAVDVHESGQE